MRRTIRQKPARPPTAIWLLTLAASLLCPPRFSRGEDPAAATPPAPLQSYHLIRFAAQNSDLPAQPMTLGASRAQFAIMVKRHDDLAEKYDAGQKVLNRTLIAANGALVAGVALGPETGGGSLVVSVGAYFASVGLQELKDNYDKAASEAVRARLAHDIASFEAQAPARWAQLKAGGNPQEIYNALHDTLHGVADDPFSKIPVEEQPLVQRLYLKEVVRALDTHLGSLEGVAAAQQGELEQNTKDIRALSSAFIKYADQQTARLNEIVQDQQAIQQGVQAIQQQTDRNTEDIGFIHEYMFGHMTAAEQRTALRQGFFPDMPPEQRAALDRKLELVDRREKFNQHLHDYAQGAQDIVNIANNLGVDPKLMKPVSEAVEAFGIAAGAVEKFAAGNVLGGISALSSLLGIGGPDVATQRHEQLMGALQQIYGALGGMDEKLDRLLEGQGVILETQKAIYESIVQLSEQVEHSHQETLEKLQQLRHEEFYNRSLLLGTFNAQYENCRRLILDQPATSGRPLRIYLDTAHGLYPSYETFLHLYEDHPTEFQNANQLFASTFIWENGERQFNRQFALESHRTESEGVDKLLENYGRIIQLLNDGASDAEANKRLHLAMLPALTVEGLERKVQRLDTVPESYDAGVLGHWMPTLLSPDRVLLHAQLISNFHFYYQLLDANSHPLSREALADARSRRTGFDYLQEAAALVDTTLIQQSLCVGDVSLPGLYDLFLRKDGLPEAEKPRWENAEKALAGNPALAYNLLLYGLHREVAEAGSQITYHVALHATDDTLLKRVTRAPWRFVRKEEGGKTTWRAVFGSSEIVLPTTGELMDGQLRVTPQVSLLLEIRRRLTEELVLYDVLQNPGSAEENREARQLVINIAKP